MRVIGQVYVSLSVLELSVGFTPPPSSTFTIVDNDGTEPISGTFVGLDEGATVSVAGGHNFRISYVGGDGNDIVLSHVGEISYYLAEGATGEFFDNDVLIANPNLTDAPVKLTFLLEGGATIVDTRTVAAQSRMTVSVDAIHGLENASASVQVTSTSGVPLVVERTMSWDSTYYGGHTANAVPNPAMRWTFAEGFQGFFDTYVLIANATATPATATLVFLREGEAPFITSVPVGAFSRKTVYAGDYPELVNRAFGIVVDSHRAGDRRARDVFRERARKILERRSRQHGRDESVDDVVSCGGRDGDVLQHLHPVEQSVPGRRARHAAVPVGEWRGDRTRRRRCWRISG